MQSDVPINVGEKLMGLDTGIESPRPQCTITCSHKRHIKLQSKNVKEEKPKQLINIPSATLLMRKSRCQS
jgi:hypothetical protein